MNATWRALSNFPAIIRCGCTRCNRSIRLRVSCALSNQMLLTLGAVAVLAGALIAFYLARQITRPLERLVTRHTALEKGDFEFQIPISGNDEVADLTRRFRRYARAACGSRGKGCCAPRGSKRWDGWPAEWRMTSTIW